MKKKYFTPNNFIFFRDLTLDLGKVIEKWHKLFLIGDFGRDYGVSYTFKTLNGNSAPNTNYNDYLCISRTCEAYLHPANEEPLKITRNLHFRRKKD